MSFLTINISSRGTYDEYSYEMTGTLVEANDTPVTITVYNSSTGNSRYTPATQTNPQAYVQLWVSSSDFSKIHGWPSGSANPDRMDFDADPPHHVESYRNGSDVVIPHALAPRFAEATVPSTAGYESQESATAAS